MPSPDRSAASVTLDTIIEEALRSVIYGKAVTFSSGRDDPRPPHASEYVPQLPVEAGARAVTDALLAKGHIRHGSIAAGTPEHVCIPLEAS